MFCLLLLFLRYLFVLGKHLQ
uniref:Uncharacterized protein n=1 Tax=Anguilla anguilla TaxID=7936 RepID=A0A0E9TIA6_ANGAN